MNALGRPGDGPSEGEGASESFLQLEPLIDQEFVTELIPIDELRDRVQALERDPRLTELGQSCMGSVYDALHLRRPEWGIEIAHSLADARLKIFDHLARSERRMGYVTGGLEAGWHHHSLIDSLPIDPGVYGVAIGLEPDSYIEQKGREPIFDLQERVSLWHRVAPANSVIFTIPKRPDGVVADEYYDWLADQVGVLKNPRIVFIGGADDSMEVKEARRRRATSEKNIVEVNVGIPPMHTSDLFVNPPSPSTK